MPPHDMGWHHANAARLRDAENASYAATAAARAEAASAQADAAAARADASDAWDRVRELREKNETLEGALNDARALANQYKELYTEQLAISEANLNEAKRYEQLYYETGQQLDDMTEAFNEERAIKNEAINSITQQWAMKKKQNDLIAQIMALEEKRLTREIFLAIGYTAEGKRPRKRPPIATSHS